MQNEDRPILHVGFNVVIGGGDAGYLMNLFDLSFYRNGLAGGQECEDSEDSHESRFAETRKRAQNSSEAHGTGR